MLRKAVGMNQGLESKRLQETDDNNIAKQNVYGLISPVKLYIH